MLVILMSWRKNRKLFFGPTPTKLHRCLDLLVEHGIGKIIKHLRYVPIIIVRRQLGFVQNKKGPGV